MLQPPSPCPPCCARLLPQAVHYECMSRSQLLNLMLPRTGLPAGCNMAAEVVPCSSERDVRSTDSLVLGRETPDGMFAGGRARSRL